MAKKEQTFDYNVDTSGVKESEENKRREAQREAEALASMTAWQRFTAFFKNGRTRFGAGIVLIIVGIYFMITFLSFILFAGSADQNRVANYDMIANAKEQAVSNMGGAVGATTSNFLINDGIGVAAFIIVIWCFTIGYRLVKNRRTFFYSYTLMSLLSIFTLSLVLGLGSASLMLPILFRFGAEKGRIAYLIFIGVICGGGVALSLSASSAGDFTAVPSPNLGLCVGAIVFYIASWRLSVALYNRREL